MQSPGRAEAAILVLDRILQGEASEKALTSWARGARFAGSKDRAAVRDLVYAALRQRRSAAALGGVAVGDAPTGRALVLGLLRAEGADISQWFDGSAHGPQPPQPGEEAKPVTGAAVHDLPDWLEAPLEAALGADFAPIMRLMRERAPVIVRVNVARITREALIRVLAGDAIVAVPHALAATALEVTEGARRLSATEAYEAGLFDLQDAASQALVEALPLSAGLKVLDYCAGGGGKTLAMAAQAPLELYAHDSAPRRMEDLKTRAARAGVAVELTATPAAAAPFDLVLTDVPCSGSGSWRRDPEGKWRLTAERLAELCAIQAQILETTAPMVRVGGHLAYATCSFLAEENETQIERFLAAHPSFERLSQRRYSPLEGGDGFYMALLRRKI